MSKRKYNVITD